jgi:hypothetical protein
MTNVTELPARSFTVWKRRLVKFLKGEREHMPSLDGLAQDDFERANVELLTVRAAQVGHRLGKAVAEKHIRQNRLTVISEEDEEEDD